MSEVIQPAPGQTVITTDHDHHRHHDGGHRNHLDELIAREQAAFGRQANADSQTIVRDVKDTRFDLAGVVDRVGAATALGFGGVHDRLCDAKSGIVGAVDRGFAAEALADCKLGDEIADSKLFSAVQFKDQVIEANKNAANTANLISTVAAASNVLATTIGNAAAVQATANYNGTTVQIERTRAELEAKIDGGFAAAALAACKCCGDQALEAAKNFAALQAQADRNACDVKQLITADGNTTRALINTNTIEALRAQLVATQRLIPVTIPVGAG